MDLLERFEVLKYVGREIDSKKLIIDPIVIKKKNLQIGVYSLGYTLDDNLNQVLEEKSIKFLNLGKFDHHILIVHQNRLQGNQRKNLKPHLKLDLLDKYQFNLVLWGHEHEAFKKLEAFPQLYKFKIYQPGSTIATSLRQSEAISKSVGILNFQKNDFDLQVIDLKKPRKILMLDIDLEESMSEFNKQLNTLEEQIIDYAKQKLCLQISTQNKLPLVRLRLFCQKNLDIDKYQLDYQIKKFAANKKNAILVKRKYKKFNIEKEDYINVLNKKDFNFQHKSQNQYQKVQSKFNQKDLDTKILDQQGYFQIMRCQNNQANMVQNFLESAFDSMEQDFQLSMDKCLQKQSYLMKDIDEILNNENELKSFYNHLKEDIEETEFVNQETIELTHKILNNKQHSESKQIIDTNQKIQLENQNFKQFQKEKNSNKKFKKSRKSR